MSDPAPEIETTPSAPDPLRQIVKWICEGQAEGDIVDAIGAKYPDARARPLIVAALQHLKEAGERPDIDLVRGFAMEGTREIFRKANEIGDHATALRALKQLTELARTAKH